MKEEVEQEGHSPRHSTLLSPLIFSIRTRHNDNRKIENEFRLFAFSFFQFLLSNEMRTEKKNLSSSSFIILLLTSKNYLNRKFMTNEKDIILISSNCLIRKSSVHLSDILYQLESYFVFGSPLDNSNIITNEFLRRFLFLSNEKRLSHVKLRHSCRIFPLCCR